MIQQVQFLSLRILPLFASSDIYHTFFRNITGVLGVGFSLYNTQEFESNYLGTVESSNRYRFKIGAWIENVYKFKIYTGLNVNSININFTVKIRTFN